MDGSIVKDGGGHMLSVALRNGEKKSRLPGMKVIVIISRTSASRVIPFITPVALMRRRVRVTSGMWRRFTLLAAVRITLRRHVVTRSSRIKRATRLFLVKRRPLRVRITLRVRRTRRQVLGLSPHLSPLLVMLTAPLRMSFISRSRLLTQRVRCRPRGWRLVVVRSRPLVNGAHLMRLQDRTRLVLMVPIVILFLMSIIFR